MKSLDKVVLGIFLMALVTMKFSTGIAIVCAITGGYLIRSLSNYKTELFGKGEQTDE